MTTLLTPDQAETISKHGFSVSSQAPSPAVSDARPNARPAADPKKALREAQLAYGAHIRQTPGVTEHDVDSDILSAELLAMRIHTLVRDCLKYHKASSDRPTDDGFICGPSPMSHNMLCEVVVEALNEGAGASREWAKLLTETVKIEAV